MEGKSIVEESGPPKPPTSKVMKLGWETGDVVSAQFRTFNLDDRVGNVRYFTLSY